MTAIAPMGYVEIARPSTRIIVRQENADALVHITSEGTAWEWAAKQPGVEVFEGRVPVYATQLPFGGPDVVVRRNHHGGMLAGLRGDRFFRLGIPREVFVARVLANAGVPTPFVVAQISYRINTFERRVDVITERLPRGQDLGRALLAASAPELRATWWDAIGKLLRGLGARGIWHPDLNVKNVYLVDEGEQPCFAVLLDVDRVRFHPPGPLVAKANVARLARSLRKWRDTRGASVTEEEIRELMRNAVPG